MPHSSHSSADRVSTKSCNHHRRRRNSHQYQQPVIRGARGLSQQRAALGEDGDIEGGWKPVDERAQRLKRFVTVACFDAEPGKVTCGIQFEEAGSLPARLCDGALIAEPGLL